MFFNLFIFFFFLTSYDIPKKFENHLANDGLDHSTILSLNPFTISRFCRNVTVFSGSRRPEDPTQLIFTFEVTELVGIVSLLYGILLHGGAPARSSSGQAGGAGSTPAEMSPHTAGVILAGLRMLNHMAALDLRMLQVNLRLAWNRT